MKSIYEFYSHYTSKQNILYITEDCKDCICEINCGDFYCTVCGHICETSGLILFLPISFFVGLFYLNKSCGKNNSRIISIIFLTLCEIIFMIMSIIEASETIYDKFTILNIIISFIGIIIMY